MKTGTIVEYIDKQKIIIASILSFKNERLKILNEEGKEINLNKHRLSHISNFIQIDIKNTNKIIEDLKKIKEIRENLKNKIDIKDLWEKIQNENREWLDIKTMSMLSFNNTSDDETSAVVRAFFGNRIYFKFKGDRFKPRNAEGVKEQKIKKKKEEKNRSIVKDGTNWLKNILNNNETIKKEKKIVEILKDFYLFGKNSKTAKEAKNLLKKMNFKTEEIFDLMIKLKEWNKNENLDILKANIKKKFSKETLKKAIALKEIISFENRENFTHLHTTTIDSQTTTDFDDAISIEEKNEEFILYIHIADVAHYIKKDDEFDKIAFRNVSSIYMPDDKIYMLPPFISEDLCSLKKNKQKYAITTIINFDKNFEIKSSKVVPSIIEVKEQTSYSKVFQEIDTNKKFSILYKLSKNLKKKRFQNGAMQIFLPEINIYFDDYGKVHISKTKNENPAKTLVSEIMIVANNKMAKFLSSHNIPAIFRTQLKPKKRIIQDESEHIFFNALQKKFLNRTVLKSKPYSHAGLGLNEYITATSPIRRYFDLINQRQIRGVLGLNPLYSIDEIKQIYGALEEKAKTVINLQNSRKRFWILKYIEKKIGKKTPAIVIDKRKYFYIIMLEEYILECKLYEKNIELKPNDRIKVTIQHSNARKDILSVYL